MELAEQKARKGATAIWNKATDLGLSAMGLERKKDMMTTTSQATDASPLDPSIQASVDQAAQESAAIAHAYAKRLNEALDDPAVKQDLIQAIEHLGDLGEVALQSAEKPLERAIEMSVHSGTKVMAAAASGAMKVGTDLMAAIPGVGAVIEVGKILNDGSKAASTMVEAAADFAETATETFAETTDNLKQGMRELEERKKQTADISQRTQRSIQHFLGGGTLRHKPRHTTKRVRFAL